MAAVALMPGAVFLVSNFNYDYWLIALVAYSIAYLIGEYQHQEKILTVKDIVLIFGTFLVGILAKPVYIPLLGLAAFLPKEKFKSVKWRRVYRCFFGGVVVLAVLGFAVLIFGGGLGSGDMRGGEGVNAAGQIQYILSNPMKYTGLLLSYLRFQYLNMTMFKAFIVQTAYYWSIPALAMPCLSGLWLLRFLTVAAMMFVRSAARSRSRFCRLHLPASAVWLQRCMSPLMRWEQQPSRDVREDISGQS